MHSARRENFLPAAEIPRVAPGGIIFRWQPRLRFIIVKDLGRDRFPHIGPRPV